MIVELLSLWEIPMHEGTGNLLDNLYADEDEGMIGEILKLEL